MDDVAIALQKIRIQAYKRRNRDTYGRYAQDGHAPRSAGLYVRLTPAERDMIRGAAVAGGETITDTVVHAVRLYGTMIR